MVSCKAENPFSLHAGSLSRRVGNWTSKENKNQNPVSPRRNCGIHLSRSGEYRCCCSVGTFSGNVAAPVSVGVFQSMTTALGKLQRIHSHSCMSRHASSYVIPCALHVRSRFIRRRTLCVICHVTLHLTSNLVRHMSRHASSYVIPCASYDTSRLILIHASYVT